MHIHTHTPCQHQPVASPLHWRRSPLRSSPWQWASVWAVPLSPPLPVPAGILFLWASYQREYSLGSETEREGRMNAVEEGLRRKGNRGKNRLCNRGTLYSPTPMVQQWRFICKLAFLDLYANEHSFPLIWGHLPPKNLQTLNKNLDLRFSILRGTSPNKFANQRVP